MKAQRIGREKERKPLYGRLVVLTDTKHFQLLQTTHSFHPQARCKPLPAAPQRRCGTATSGGAAPEPGRPSPDADAGGKRFQPGPARRSAHNQRRTRTSPAPLRSREVRLSRPRDRRLSSEPRPARPPIAPAWPPAQGPMAERVALASLRRALLALRVTALVPGPGGSRVRPCSEAAWRDGASAEGRNQGARGQRSGRPPEQEQVAARTGRTRAAKADGAVEWAGPCPTVGGRKGVVCRGRRGLPHPTLGAGQVLAEAAVADGRGPLTREGDEKEEGDSLPAC
ncbi:hypothetical protein P7K49_012197 [Saguinus oedipus]|uniref:Uncharacterized protein n=1 Tax=Saguinus oedipus TaxID=9490 RepID=A0ABQ9VTE1_SAGOE|nr:hypothetical protein P7K49_012197 [Saguinus oedipus]